MVIVRAAKAAGNGKRLHESESTHDDERRTESIAGRQPHLNQEECLASRAFGPKFKLPATVGALVRFRIPRAGGSAPTSQIVNFFRWMIHTA